MLSVLKVCCLELCEVERWHLKWLAAGKVLSMIITPLQNKTKKRLWSLERLEIPRNKYFLVDKDEQYGIVYSRRWSLLVFILTRITVMNCKITRITHAAYYPSEKGQNVIKFAMLWNENNSSDEKGLHSEKKKVVSSNAWRKRLRVFREDLLFLAKAFVEKYTFKM